MKHYLTKNFTLNNLCSALILAGVIATPAFAQKTSDIGTIKIAEEGDSLGNGYMINEDGVKQKTTITKAAIDKSVPSQNVTDFLGLAPGVNSMSYDGTGLYGGSISYRGFAMNQMGYTVNGAPVNDAANYAVYPMEYVDSENLCEVFVTGSADNEAPHVAASGGNVGLVTCRPSDVRAGKIIQSVGSNRFYNTFARVDSGLFSENFLAKMFLSYSHGETNKFNGFGGAKRDHLEAGLDWKVSSSTKFESTVMFNQMFNNSLFNPTKAQWSANPSIEYSNTPPTNISSGASSTQFGFTSSTYYGFQNNPFRNLLATTKLSSQIDEKLTLSAEPYYWYGYGSGPGAGTLTLAASSAPNSVGITPGGTAYPLINPYTGAVNSSASAITIGGIIPNIQHSNRTGITLTSKYDLESHKILGGVWFERAVKTQTQPFITVNSNGEISDSWARGGYALTSSGYPYEKRNYQTQTESRSIFLNDTYSLNNKIDIVPAVKWMQINRGFQNSGSSGTGLGLDYSTTVQYNSFLPSFGSRYKLDSRNQLFGNVTRGAKAPAATNSLAGWVVGSTCSATTTASVSSTTGKVSGCVLPNTPSMEKSTTFEAGHRYFGDNITSSVAIFNTTFSNRLSSAYNPITGIAQDYNVGGSTIVGLEGQLGTKPVNGWSAYLSGSFTKSTINDDFLTTTTSNVQTTLNTSGKQMPDTPRVNAGASVQYSTGPMMAAISAKYTGVRYSTLVNDESMDPFTLFNLSAGYKFADNNFLQSPTIRFNIQNLFNSKYLISGANYSGADIKTTTNSSISGGGSPTYYVGAPMFVSLSLSSEFK
jgi:iron complex outermembrane receptor protein